MKFPLILLAAFSQTFSSHGTSEKKQMDMSPDAVDDAFSQCRERMLQAVIAPDGLLKQELNTNDEFRKLWKASGNGCKKLPGMTLQHVAALRMFGQAREKFHKQFGDLVESKGWNSTDYRDNFPFKALHFLLTDAIHLLNNGTKCTTVFSGTSTEYRATVGTKVRFGRFFSAFSVRGDAIESCSIKGTLFNITTCSALAIDQVCPSEYFDLFISPTEVFEVVKQENKDNDECETEITLKHSGFQSGHDCYLFPRSASPSTGTFNHLSNSRLIVLQVTAFCIFQYIFIELL